MGKSFRCFQLHSLQEFAILIWIGENAMNKKIITVVLVFLVALSMVGAATTRFKASIAMNTGYADATFTYEQDRDPKFEFSVNAGIAILGKSWGGFVKIETELTGSNTKLLLAGAYNKALSGGKELFLHAGPKIGIGGQTTLGVEMLVGVEFTLSKAMFVRLSTGLDMEFVQFKKPSNTYNFKLGIPLPEVAIGWNF